MKYYLSLSLISDLIFSEVENRKIIEKEIHKLIQTNARLFTSAGVIAEIFSGNKSREIYPVFLKQIEILCDSIYPVEFEDCTLAERLHSEFGGEKNLLIEFALCIRNNVDFFLTTQEIKIQQKLISVQRIALKAE